MAYYNHITFDHLYNDGKIRVAYKDVELLFNATYFTKGVKRKTVEISSNPFSEFNEFLKTKPKTWHEEKFPIYQEMVNDIAEYNDVRVLLNVLNVKLIKLYDENLLVELAQWIISPNSTISIPIKQQQNYAQDTTYNYDDYLQLIAYSLGLRFAAPVWGAITNRLHAEYGDDKEIHSYSLLHGTCMVTKYDPAGQVIRPCYAETRLKDFIVSIGVKLKMDVNSVLLAGLSEEDYYHSLFTVAVLRKITLGDFLINNTYNLISTVFYFIQNKIKAATISYNGGKSPGTSKASSVSARMKKKPTQDLVSDMNSQSVIDVGFVRSRFPEDEICFLIYCARDHQRIINTIEPNLPMELYHQSMASIRQMNTNDSYLGMERQGMKPIQKVQLTLTKWLIHTSVNEVIFDHLELDDIIGLIGVARAIYWYWGYYDMASIISSIALPVTLENMYISPGNMQKNIDPNVMTQLNQTYDLGGVTKSERRNMTPIGCIELINQGISEYSWFLTLPPEWMVQNKVNNDQGYYIPPSDMRLRIGELMLEINRRQSFTVTDFPNTPNA